MLREAIEKGEFVITCEFVPGRGKDGPAIDAPIKFAKYVVESGINVHAISLTDNPGGNPAISPDILAGEIQREGIDALVHFSCRDLNRNAVESRLCALSRAGINNLLVITGDYTEGGYEGKAAKVFDLDAVQAIKYIKSLNAGLEIPGRKKGTVQKLPETRFFVGAGVSPFKLTEAELLPQFFKMEKKIAAGADFIIPQLGYDMRKFFEIKRFMASRNINVPLIGNVYVLSLGAGRVMAAGLVPGCVVTEELLEILKEEYKSEDKGKAKRLERASKMVATFKGMGFNGVHIGGFALKPEDFSFIIERALELESRWEEFIPELQFGRKNEFYAFPEPESYKITEPDDDPVKLLNGQERKTFTYGSMECMHKLFFEKGSLGCNFIKYYYKGLGSKKFFSKLTHFFEIMIKMAVFECRDCGDCALPDLAYCCPQSKCAKQQRNGPCGGSTNGMCEVYPDEKACVWTIVYNRLKSSGRLDEMRNNYVPPRKMDLEYTSCWANYFLGKDHASLD